MSDSVGSHQNGEQKRVISVPRATIHKRILDVAESNPSASMEELAEQVPSATTDLVERVLEEYGDPAETPESSQEGETETDERTDVSHSHPGDVRVDAEQGDATTDTRDETLREELPHPTELAAKQLEVFRLIREHPDATQQELGDHLDLSKGTINKRINAVEGFAWDDRQAFVEQLFEGAEQRTDGSSATAQAPDKSAVGAPEGVGDTTHPEALQARVRTLEEKVDDESRTSQGIVIDESLAPKVVLACMDSGRLTTEEQVEILRMALGDS